MAQCYKYATHYSYDPQGNVQTVVQDIPALQSVYNRYKRIDYDYDLQSGKVNEVDYEKDSIDEFSQQYSYDADLRLTNVMTSADRVQWDNDASYNYYEHGPLARMELGRRQVQGLDYAYTINGWLKGINSSTGLIKNDMGGDAKDGSMVGADAYGMVLGYYSGDYAPIKKPAQPFELTYAGSDFDNASSGLYNGNIRNATVALRNKLYYYGDSDISMSPIGYAYTYDQLNRYVQMRAYNNIDTATNTWQSGGAALQDYAENVGYDGNGNILAYIRHGNPTVGYPTGPTAMDSMAYIYNINTNQLNSVADGVSSSNYTTDIDNEVGDNYKYDKNGELIFDSSQHLTIVWNVRNKINMVYNDSTKLLITFGYDAMGNRIMKKDTNLSTHKCYTQWYIRDAQGNPLAIYKERNDSLWWQESDIYGSSRVGVYYADSLIYPKGAQVNKDDTFSMELWEGKRQYSISNQLGNVQTTISDKKIMLSSNMLNGTGRNAYANIASYQPEVVSISDLYPYGSQMPGRTFSLSDDSSYRYGFNGQEKDDDIEGEGDLNTAEFWEYDTRLGGRKNPDPKPLAWQSNYVAFLDNPLWHSDVLGNSVDGGPDDGQTASTNTTATGIGTTSNLINDVPKPVNNKPVPAQANTGSSGVTNPINTKAQTSPTGTVTPLAAAGGILLTTGEADAIFPPASPLTTAIGVVAAGATAGAMYLYQEYKGGTKGTTTDGTPFKDLRTSRGIPDNTGGDYDGGNGDGPWPKGDLSTLMKVGTAASGILAAVNEYKKYNDEAPTVPKQPTRPAVQKLTAKQISAIRTWINYMNNENGTGK